MAASNRQVVFTVVIDLAKGSKEAHMVTVERIGKELGATAMTLMNDKGYAVKAANVTTLLHYVRHNKTTVLKAVRKATTLRRVV